MTRLREQDGSERGLAARQRGARCLAWLLAWGACAVGAWAQAAADDAADEGPARPPDVLLIILDDVNDWVGYLDSYPGARTPAIDRLADRGVAFTNAHCVVPVCNPSRIAMLGGVRPAAKVRISKPMPDVLSLPRHFSDHGYHLAVAGKVFHELGDAVRPDEQFAVDHDTRALEGAERSGEAVDVVTLGLNKPEKFDWQALQLEDEQMPDHQIATWACERLLRDGDEPLFLAVGLQTPHLPWLVPEEYFALHPLEGIQLPEVREGDRDDLPQLGRGLAGNVRMHNDIARQGLWPRAVQAYLASISFADSQVGRLLEALERSPRADRTIVVLTSDHGFHLGEKSHWRKFTLWEDATHVPLVISAPGQATGSCSRPVDLQALYPTLCGLAGLPVPAHVEGVDLQPLLADPQAPWEHAAFTAYKGHRAIRTERWRYILYANGDAELYDHDRDPGEFTNLAGLEEYRDQQSELQVRLKAQFAR